MTELLPHVVLRADPRWARMLGVAIGGRFKPKHGRKAKRGQALGGRSGRAYRVR